MSLYMQWGAHTESTCCTVSAYVHMFFLFRTYEHVYDNYNIHAYNTICAILLYIRNIGSIIEAN